MSAAMMSDADSAEYMRLHGDEALPLAFVAELGTIIREVIGAEVCPLRLRIADLERELQQQRHRLETVKGFTYRGVWTDGVTYEPGDFATRDGGMFACVVTTQSRPGESHDWVLAVKRGAISRPAKDHAQRLPGTARPR
jgi:hypothetical protein